MDTDKPFVERLTDPTLDSPQLLELVETELARARQPARDAALIFATSKNPDEALTALGFLQNAEELSVLAVAVGPQRDDPIYQLQRITVMVHGETELRRRVVVALDPLLEDARVIPNHRATMEEEIKLPIRRVCDVAFLAMAQVVYFGDDAWQENLEEHGYLALTLPERDQVIARGRATGRWQRALNPNAEVE